MQSEMATSPTWIHCGLRALSNKHICWLVFIATNHKVTSTSKHCDVKCKANIIQRSLPFCTGYPRAFLFRAIIHPCKNPIKKMTMKRLESEGHANCMKAKQMSAMTTYTESKIPVLFSLPYLWVSFRHWYCNSRRKLFLATFLDEIQNFGQNDNSDIHFDQRLSDALDSTLLMHIWIFLHEVAIWTLGMIINLRLSTGKWILEGAFV